MGSSVVDLGPGLVVALLALTALAGTVGRASGLEQQRPVVTAALRATGQLAAVSAVLVAVVGSLWLSALFVLVMVTVAAVTAAGRVTRLPARAAGAWRRSAALVLGSGAVPLRGIAVIPIAGIVIGGAVTATSLAGRRLRDELQHRRGEVEAALALGLLPRDAVLEIARPAAATALVRRWTRPEPWGWSPCPAPSSASCSAAAAPWRPAPPSCWCWSGCWPHSAWPCGSPWGWWPAGSWVA